MQNFVIIKERRIRKTGIKEYEPVGEKSLMIKYNHSRNKPETMMFHYDGVEARDLVVIALDNML